MKQLPVGKNQMISYNLEKHIIMINIVYTKKLKKLRKHSKLKCPCDIVH